jgi:mannuronan synthase
MASTSPTTSTDPGRPNRAAVPVRDFAGVDEHPVLRIPFTASLDGRTYEGAGLSIVGASVKGLAAPHLGGQTRLATLQFHFEGYVLSLLVSVRIEAASSESGMLSLRFLEPTGPHLPQLRYLLNAYVAGEVVEVDGLLDASARRNDAARIQPKSINGSLGRLKRLLGGVAIALASAALVGVVGIGLHERFFVIDADGLSTVTVEGMTLRAISAGQIEFLNPEAKAGQPLFSIKAVSGDSVTVSMPCDCRVVPGQVVTGETVLAGEPVVQVSAADARPLVHAKLNARGVRELAGGARVEIVLPGGRSVRATYSTASTFSGAPAAQDAVEVTLIPGSGVTLADLGQPVSVRVLTFPWQRVQPLLDSLRAYTSN